MSWRDRYLEQAKVWRALAQKEASQGRESEAELANLYANTYKRLAAEEQERLHPWSDELGRCICIGGCCVDISDPDGTLDP